MGQTDFGMPRGAQMSLALHSNSNTTSKHAPSQVERNYSYYLEINQPKIVGDQSPMKSLIKLRMTQISEA